MLYTFPPNTVHASFPLRPLNCFSRLGGTRRYGVPGGRPERDAVVEHRRAQSRGECPGVKRTFLWGLDGGAVCVGGGVSPIDVEGGPRLGSGEGRGGGAIKYPFPFEGATDCGEADAGAPFEAR